MSPAFRNPLATEKDRVHLLPALSSPPPPTEVGDPGLIQTPLPAPCEALLGHSLLCARTTCEPFSNSRVQTLESHSAFRENHTLDL